MGIHLYAATADAYNFPNTWFIRDDAYYYFKVAQNITEGLGSTFDGINPTNGYHPLWMLVCIPIFYFARFDLILPLRILLMVVALLQAGTAILLYRIISRSLSRSVAMLAASFWAFEPYIHYALYRPGLESPLAVFLIVLFIERLGRFESDWRTNEVTGAQISWLAVIAALMMFSRLDLVFLAVIAGIYIVFRGHPLRYLLPLDIAVMFFSMTTSIALRLGFPDYNEYAASAVFSTIIAIILKTAVFYFAGLYQHPNRKTVGELARKTFVASLVGSTLFFISILFFMQAGVVKSFPSIALLFDWGIGLSLMFTLRLSARWFGNKVINANLSTPQPVTELRLNWSKWIGEGWLYYRVLGGSLALYMLYNKVAFGVSSPVSGQIKRWWGTLLHTVYDYPANDWTAFFGIAYHGHYDSWAPISHTIGLLAKWIKPLYRGSDTEDVRYYIVMSVLVLMLFLILILNARRTLRAFSNMALIPLLAGSVIHTLSYTATAYGGAKEWYWLSQMLLAVFILSMAIDFLLKPLRRFTSLRLSFDIAAVAAGISFVYVLGGFIFTNILHNYYPADQPYMEVTTYLEEHTRPNTIIGMTGGGNVAYFIKDRTIVNMDGLINSYEYFHALQQREAPLYLRNRGMRVVFANIRLLSFPPYDNQFTPYLVTFDALGNKNLMWLMPKPKKW